MADPTLEKDVDVTTDRDVSRAVDRTSYTGSDDKSKTYSSVSDLKVDIGEAEAVASGLANSTGPFCQASSRAFRRSRGDN